MLQCTTVEPSYNEQKAPCHYTDIRLEIIHLNMERDPNCY